jgi:hypothetical protein
MHLRRRGRFALLGAGAVTALAAGTLAPTGVDATVLSASRPHFDKHTVVVSGLDNPRQLSFTPNGRLLVAQAGHGGKACSHGQCVGKTSKVSVIRPGHARNVMSGLLSGAGKDGTFATGVDGASKRAGGAFYGIVTSAPPDLIPQGLPGRQAGKLLAKRPGGKLRQVANISAYEARHDVDGEGVESNPYAVLALKNQVLVADAAGDYIASVRHGKVSTWTVMPEYGRKIDAVPTSLALGPDGHIYVGELHSERPGKAKVWKFDRRGNAIRSWGGFTTVTGVARGRDGSLYVSELFGGPCTFDQIPTCFPGRVVKVSPNGDRSYRRVPFPAGIAVRNGHVNVAVFSVSPATGFGGNPAWSGAVWRVFGR